MDRFTLSIIQKIHLLAVTFVAGLGFFALLDWCAGLERLHTLFPRLGQLPPQTALTFLLAALSLWFWRTPHRKLRAKAARGCAAVVGVLTGGQYLQGVGVLPVIGGDPQVVAATSAAPMALNTALSFILIAAALWLLERETKRGESPAEWLLAISAFFPFAALVAHIFDRHALLNPLLHPFALEKMELHTAIGLLALCAATFTIRPERGWMARFASNRPEGIVARRLLPAALAALLVFGWLSKAGERAGFYEPDDGAVLLVTLTAFTFGLLIRHSMQALAALETRRRNTESSLQHSKTHLRMALDGARVGTWEWDMRTNVVQWSDSISEIFGLPPGAFDGRYETYLGLIHPGDREALKARLRFALENPGELYRSEHRIVWSDGSVHWLSARGNVIRDGNGTPIRMAGTTMDITERKMLERELIDASNREQRRLGQDLHDDLGQWLTGIHLEARALSMRLKSKSEADAVHAEKISTWAGEALERTRMLVRGMAPAVIETAGLTAALREIAANTERMFRIRCYCTCDESLTVHNTEISLQLYRIAQEAISNAIRHSQATEVRLNLSLEAEGRVCLSIRDNGKGIAYPPPKTPGMGLRIMQFRAGLLGGHVEIRPAKNGGTEVVCSLSLKE